MGGPSLQPEDAEQRLEHHVDDMMDIKRPDIRTTGRGASGAPDMPPIDIFDTNPGHPAFSRPEKQTPEPLADQVPDQPQEPGPSDYRRQRQADVSSEQIPQVSTLDETTDDPIVDDIISSESNELLAARDAEIARAFAGQSPAFGSRLKDFMAAWWDNRIARYGTLGGVLLIVALAAIMPASRYYVLNTMGVRSNASVSVLDSTTNLPLQNVSVTLADTHARTDKNGVAHLAGIRLGTQQLTIQQAGFARISRTVSLGFGTNSLGQLSLKAVGTQFRFVVSDYLSGKPIIDVEASSGDNDAKADSRGGVVLTIGKLTGPTMDVTFTAYGYRKEKVTINTATPGLTTVSMVTDKKAVYVTKQSGKLDVYKSDLDGKNKQLLLAGTGLERSQITLVTNPDDDTAALVSSRVDKRDGDGYLLDSLTLINIKDGSNISLDSSERVQLVDWIGSKLIYVKIKAGTSAGNSQRYQLMSYDVGNTNRQVLASANYFTDIVSAKGTIYYAQSNNYYPGGQSLFGKVNPDTTGKQTLLSADIYNILRNSYDGLDLASQNKWYGYHLGDASAKDAAQPPANTNETRYYLDGPDGKNSLWTEPRDGKGALLVYDSQSGKDTVLATQSGLTYPLQWLDGRTVIYRIQTPQETAAYTVSLDGGTPKKITDETNTFGFGKFGYYY